MLVTCIPTLASFLSPSYSPPPYIAVVGADDIFFFFPPILFLFACCQGLLGGERKQTKKNLKKVENQEFQVSPDAF